MENINLYRKLTIEYYDQNAAEFVNATIGADMERFYAEFEKYIELGGSILDLGCGSGRDSKYFYEKGYHVIAIDASIAMCEETRRRVPVEVHHMKAEDVVYIEEFDAVWACASLLHVLREDMQITFKKIMDAMKAKGIFYGSWKYGEGNRVDGGRYFADYTEKEMLKLIESIHNIELVKMWVTEDVRSEKEGTRWLNILARKTDKQNSNQ